MATVAASPSPAFQSDGSAAILHGPAMKIQSLLWYPFDFNDDGYIVPQNVSATAQSPVHRAAADCMRRELLGLPFRGPAGARGQQAQVKMTVPSVD